MDTRILFCGVVGLLVTSLVIGCLGGEETAVAPITTTEPPQILQAPETTQVKTSLSLSEQKKFFYEVVAEEDKCGSKWALDPCMVEASTRVIEKYGITTEEAMEISVRGIEEGWPMPPPSY